GSTVLEALLAPHRSFLPDVAPHLERGGIKALAHITGGGLPGNLPRALPAGLGCLVHRGSWPEPPIFAHLQARGEISDDEMFAVFNMGIGMVLIASPER